MTSIPSLLSRFRPGLRLQLMLGLGFLSFLLLAVVVMALWAMNYMDEERDAVLQGDVRISRVAAQVAIQGLAIRQAESQFFDALESADDLPTAQAQWQQVIDNLAQAVEEFAANATSADDQQHVPGYRETVFGYRSRVAQLLQSIEQGDFSDQEYGREFLNPYRDDVRLLTTEMAELAQSKAANAQAAETMLDAIGQRTIWQMGIISALALITAVGWSLLFPVRLMRPVVELHAATNRLSQGDLTARVERIGDDELGQLAQAFNQMVTELATSRERLESWNKVLEATVRERTSALERTTAAAKSARATAEQANQMKSQFLANMSHELRTPLNSIINFARILSSGMRGPVTDGQRDYLDRIRTSGDHLLGLINDILDISKIEAGRLELNKEPCQLGELVHSVMATAAGLTRGKPIVLHQELPPNLPTVAIDRTRIRQVLLNLLSNAAKFTDEGSITVRVLPTYNELVVSVADTGIGIAPEHLDLIFEEFRQVDAGMNRSYEGTGLGLSICQRLVKLHGGRIWVESTPGIGSIFFFSLPVTVAAPQHPAQAEPPALPETTAITRPFILVVDDDPSAIEIVSSYLGSDGYTIYGITDSTHTLEVARQLQPDAIILDILMPQKDGWQVLAELKCDAQTQEIPIVLYTIVEQQQLGLQLGANAYLVKPIDEDLLRSTVRRLVAHHATVLIVDDDPDVREILTHELTRLNGYEVLTASGGCEGLAYIATTRPDLLILDLMMPEVDGFAVLAQLDSNPQHADMPVIVLTAKDLTTDERAFLNQRVSGLLSKGGTPMEHLLRKVNTLLHGAPQEHTNV